MRTDHTATANVTTQPRNQPDSDSTALPAWEQSRRGRCWESLIGRIGQRYAGGLDQFELYGTREERARQSAVIASVRAYAANIRERVLGGQNVLLYGPPGTGKDLLMTGLLRVLVEAGGRPDWRNGADLFGDFRDGMDSGDSEEAQIAKLFSPVVLAISDPLPPIGSLTPFQSSTLFRAIDRRYRQGRPIWATMNVADGKEADERLGPQLSDRLRDGALALFCNWPSFRKSA